VPLRPSSGIPGSPKPKPWRISAMKNGPACSVSRRLMWEPTPSLSLREPRMYSRHAWDFAHSLRQPLEILIGVLVAARVGQFVELQCLVAVALDPFPALV